MSNVKTIISSDDEAQINKPSNQSEEIDNNCNCRNKDTCPLEGNCNIRNIIYQAEVATPQTKETYIGLCDTTFKERYRNHTCSFRNERYKNVTELSKYIWGLKERKINYQINWRKVKQAVGRIQIPGWGGTLGISRWGCAAGTLEPLAYTRASSAEFC